MYKVRQSRFTFCLFLCYSDNKKSTGHVLPWLYLQLNMVDGCTCNTIIHIGIVAYVTKHAILQYTLPLSYMSPNMQYYNTHWHYRICHQTCNTTIHIDSIAYVTNIY